MKFIPCLLSSAFCLLAGAAEAPKVEFGSIPEAAAPFPALAEFAKSHAIPLEGFQIPPGGGVSAIGDQVTALVTLREGKQVRQWITHLELVAPTAEEKKRVRHGWTSITTSEGKKYDYKADASEIVRIRTVGPFVAGKSGAASDKTARAAISPDFLSLGFDRAAAAFSSATQAPSEMSDADQRAVWGILPALLSFFDAVQGAPGLNDILWDITDKPSLWSVAINRGINLGVRFGEAAEVGTAPVIISSAKTYRLDIPLSLNKQPALELRLFATSPQPPLMVTAGIVGILAKPPGKSDKLLEIRVVAGRRAK